MLIRIPEGKILVSRTGNTKYKGPKDLEIERPSKVRKLYTDGTSWKQDVVEETDKKTKKKTTEDKKEEVKIPVKEKSNDSTNVTLQAAKITTQSQINQKAAQVANGQDKPSM